MDLSDFQGFTIHARRHDGAIERFHITQAQAQTWLSRSGCFRPLIAAGLGQLEAYRIPGEGTSGSEGLGGIEQAGDSRPEGATSGSEGNGDTLAAIGHHYATRTDDNA
jgi:hypothetical protein